MNLVITGSIQSGKSTWCSGYSSMLTRQGFSMGGIICPAVMENSSKIGCDALDLQSAERAIFARLKTTAGFKGEPAGRYVISHEGLAFAKKAIQEALDDNCDMVFIDEVGPLELTGKGLIEIAKDAYWSASDTTTVVRRQLLVPFLEYFRLANPVVNFAIKDIEVDTSYPVPDQAAEGRIS